MRFRYPPDNIPDIQPHTQVFMMLGPYVDRPEMYSFSVTPAGVFVCSPSGRGGYVSRHECLDAFHNTMSSVLAGTAHLYDPFMLWFRPGVDFKGDDESAFAILNGIVRGYCDYHNVRKRGYKHLLNNMIDCLLEATNDSFSTDEILKSWKQQIVIVERLLERETAYTRAFKELAHTHKLYGQDEGSLVAVYGDLPTNHALILNRYT